MRITIEADDALLGDAICVTGATSKREVVELGLAALVKLERQERIRQYRGKLNWNGDVGRMRADR